VSESLLDQIEFPRDLQGLSAEDLERLASEIRALITRTVAARGGHLASNLGVVDLTLALHRTYDFARDHLVWDVGHQCYAHKILTGRREAFEGLRTADGASGFPNPAESPYDVFRTGHAGASVSTALGLALAEQAAGTGIRTVAVIGDGALASGLALEAMNHAGDAGADLLVVLNDNEMCISRTVGALARHLTRLRAAPAYGNLKRDVHDVLDHVPMGDLLSRSIHTFKDVLKEAVVPEHMFERLGFRCYGPVDGHDIEDLVETLGELKALRGPVLLHVVTEKGRGFRPAAEKPEDWHSASPFKERNGQVLAGTEAVGRDTWTRATIDELLALAEADERLVTITAAMPEGSGLVRFAHRYPDRFFDVGICEQHAVGLAAGMARGGRRPVVGIYSTFLQRAYDQLFHEIALQGLPVVFLVDRAGLVGADGPTHHGLYDVAYVRHLPGFTVAAPADRDELADMLRLATEAEGPWTIRYPRDYVPPATFTEEAVRPGRAAVVREGKDGAVLALGATVGPAFEAAGRLADDGVEVAVVSARFVRPLDTDLLADLMAEQPWVLAVEDAAAAGGFGAAVLEAAEAMGLDASKIRRAAVDDEIVEHDTRAAQLASQGLDADGLAERLRALAETA
jgi:1-deoxy-D-xylulose-5-phosphate synthase